MIWWIDGTSYKDIRILRSSYKVWFLCVIWGSHFMEIFSTLVLFDTHWGSYSNNSLSIACCVARFFLVLFGPNFWQFCFAFLFHPFPLDFMPILYKNFIMLIIILLCFYGIYYKYFSLSLSGHCSSRGSQLLEQSSEGQKDWE